MKRVASFCFLGYWVMHPDDILIGDSSNSSLGHLAMYTEQTTHTRGWEGIDGNFDAVRNVLCKPAKALSIKWD